MSICNLCPRKCNTERDSVGEIHGFCGVGTKPVAAKACLHFWEEPCISGIGGAGTVFFSGCNLGCIYCQNEKISQGGFGKPLSVKRLREIFDELIFAGADNIDLVTPTHFADSIISALSAERLPVPVIYNCGGYEDTETLKRFEGLIDIYLPDYKYADPALAARFSFAADYPEKAWSAIEEMYRQRGNCRFDEDDMMTSGVIIRHMVLPGHTDNTLDVIDRVTNRFTDENIAFSLMSQYTPPVFPVKYEELNRRVTKEEYERCTDYLYMTGFSNGYVQELSSAKEEYTPDFDLTGIR